MRKTTPGIDRIQMQSLRSLKYMLEGKMSKHIHLCVKCSNAQGDVFEKCSEWWQMAKQLHKVRRKLRAQERPEPYSQQTLPGM